MANAATKTAKKSAPKRINPDYKLNAPQIDVLGVLHENDRWHDLGTVVSESGLSEKEALKALKNLTEREYLTAKEDGSSWRYIGLRCKALKLIVGALRLMGSPQTAGVVGSSVWGDPKVKNDPKADTRYAPAACAVLKTAFELGAVYRVEAEGSQTLFGAAA